MIRKDKFKSHRTLDRESGGLSFPIEAPRGATTEKSLRVERPRSAAERMDLRSILSNGARRRPKNPDRTIEKQKIQTQRRRRRRSRRSKTKIKFYLFIIFKV